MRGWGLFPSSNDKWIAEPSVGVGFIPILQGQADCGTKCRGGVYPHPPSVIVIYSLGGYKLQSRLEDGDKPHPPWNPSVSVQRM